MPDRSAHKTGTLYLIPSSLGNADVNVFLPGYVLKIIRSLDQFVVENEKTARQFLKLCNITLAQQQLVMHELDKHAGKIAPEILNGLLSGKNVGLLSDAGCPGVADPGAEVIMMAHKKNITVVPLVGPSSLLLALMASGLNGQRFCFYGYLPKEKSERIAAIKKAEIESSQKKQTQLFIETPYNNNRLLADLLSVCHSETLLCVASNITLPDEYIYTNRIAEWKKLRIGMDKQPTVFLMLAI